MFCSCRNWLDEFRIFERDENGKIINERKFRLMAATRYLFMGGMISRWRVNEHQSTPRPLRHFHFLRVAATADGWQDKKMSKDESQKQSQKTKMAANLPQHRRRSQ